MSMEVSISLEETNKIRVSLGLKPLAEDAPPTDDKEKQAEENYTRRREQEAKERQTQSIRDKIAKVRNKQQLHASLKGTTLGEADDDTGSTLSWVKRSRKQEKELAKKRQEEQEKMDQAFQGEEYTEKDLAGVKVSHDFDALEEGEARILTLKDSRILDNEEDELQNIEMVEEERRQKNAELKKKKKDYTGYDDDEFISGKEGMKRAVLAKYDEELEGSKEIGFRLGSSTAVKRDVRAEKEQEALAVNKSLLSIDYQKNLEITDYLQEGDIGFKKLKKKKKSSRRVPEFSDIHDVDGDVMPIVPMERNLDTNFIDDEELQAALTRSRQAKLFKRKKISPEELAKRIAVEREQEEATADIVIKAEGDEGERGLVFDDTSEFVRSIQHNPVPVKPEPVEPPPLVATPSRPSPSVEAMEVDEVVHELELGELDMKEEEEEEEDEAMLNAIENAIKLTEAEEAAAQAKAEVGTSSEQTYGTGMASTLNILRQQGILASPSADQSEREKTQLQRDLWLADQRRRIARREMERLNARGSHRDQAMREYENRLREQQESRESVDAFKNYKPDVNIVYYDEFGRSLTPKEAWKALSHKFHGKGSGRMKREKLLKKIAEEKKKEAMASGDTPLSMNKAFQIRQSKTGQAHFVLSVGNRGAVPQAAEFLDPQPLSKGKTERVKNKKKDAAKVQAPKGETGFITLPAPQTAASNSVGAGSSAVSTPNSGSPGPSMRPGFSRISSTLDSPSVSQVGTPGPDERTRVVFGLGAKRKAEEEEDFSRSKRR